MMIANFDAIKFTIGLVIADPKMQAGANAPPATDQRFWLSIDRMRNCFQVVKNVFQGRRWAAPDE